MSTQTPKELPVQNVDESEILENNKIGDEGKMKVSSVKIKGSNPGVTVLSNNNVKGKLVIGNVSIS